MSTKHYLVVMTVLLTSFRLTAQCSGFPATVAEPACGSGTPLTNNANINSGTYNFCGSSPTPTTFSSINVSGGTLNICGNVTISNLTFNSGTIVVACGATVTFAGTVTLNSNTKIVNYGRVNIGGTLNFQNTNNAFYNEGATSRLYVGTDIVFPQNNGQTAYLKNNGYISVGGTFDARNGGFSCFSAQSSLETVNLKYGTGCGAPNNSFTFSSGTGTAIVRYTGAATINGSFTSSTHYAINKGTTATQSFPCGASTWGSAAVATNAPAVIVPIPAVCLVANCFSVLPVELTGFEAIAGKNSVSTYWTTESEVNNDHFLLERSSDGQDWEAIAKISGAGHSTSTLNYTYEDLEPLRGVSYYRLKQIDFDGTQTVSEIRSVVLGREDSFVLYPNPATNTVSLLLPENTSVEQLLLIDATGRTIKKQDNLQQELLMINVSDLPKGSYQVSVTFSNRSTRLERLVVN